MEIWHVASRRRESKGQMARERFHMRESAVPATKRRLTAVRRGQAARREQNSIREAREVAGGYSMREIYVEQMLSCCGNIRGRGSGG